MIHRLSVDGFPIVLDETTLKKASRILGAVIGSGGDAANAEGWLCLQGSDESGSWIFWLTSTEIDGDAIGGFIWKRIETGATIDSRCKRLHGSNSIKLQLPLRIGMTRAEAIRILGARAPVRQSELFNLRRRNKIIDGSQYTIWNGVEVNLSSRTVVQVAAFESSSD